MPLLRLNIEINKCCVVDHYGPEHQNQNLESCGCTSFTPIKSSGSFSSTTNYFISGYKEPDSSAVLVAG